MNVVESFGIFFVPVLANEDHERYSRLRAILVPPRAAVRALGRKVSSGAATKLERNKAIRERIAELAAVDEEIVREKRAQVDAALSAIAYGDGSEFPGNRGPIRWPDRLGAIAQLRDMHGFEAPKKRDLAVTMRPTDQMTDDELACIAAGSSAGAPSST